ncbi:MAG: hypothetical protein ABSF22_13650 [Bryobacteraceae bacterium]|jgi:hypothetical protein
MKYVGAFALLSAACVCAQSDNSPLKPLAFLEGTWEAKTQQGSAGATAGGTYTFVKELGGHVLARHGALSDCKGPASFDCDHGDLLYVYQDDSTLKAIYFDNEGHVIHYKVAASSGAVEFLSDPSNSGPQFRLAYERKDSVMSGKFQMRMPGQTEWKSYLEWSGAKKP